MNTGNPAQHVFDKLVELDALDQFIKNVQEQQRYRASTNKPVDAWLWWQSTPEGHSFWQTINDAITIRNKLTTEEFLNYAHERLHDTSTYKYW